MKVVVGARDEGHVLGDIRNGSVVVPLTGLHPLATRDMLRLRQCHVAEVESEPFRAVVVVRVGGRRYVGERHRLRATLAGAASGLHLWPDSLEAREEVLDVVDLLRAEVMVAHVPPTRGGQSIKEFLRSVYAVGVNYLSPHAGLFFDPYTGWAHHLADVLLPGAHACVFVRNDQIDIEGRLAGLELRDTLSLISYTLQCQYVYLFRKPLDKDTLAEQAASTLSTGLHVEKLLIGTGEDKGIWPITDRTNDRQSMAGPMQAAETDTTRGRWPTNVLLVHADTCRAPDDSNAEWTCSCVLHEKLPNAKYCAQVRGYEGMVSWLGLLIEPVPPSSP